MRLRFFTIIGVATVALVVSAAERKLGTLPQATAAHFCQLLVCDNDGRVQSLAAFIRRNAPTAPPTRQPISADAPTTPPTEAPSPSDGPTPAQTFCSYVFDYGGWQSLRIFPHSTPDGRISWHAAEESLPPTIDAEHRRYIREVFPRILTEIEAGNWPQVDAYITRMLEYQTTFASPTPIKKDDGTLPSAPSPALLVLPFILFLATPLIGRR